jgi:uncharacterized membrane protein
MVHAIQNKKEIIMNKFLKRIVWLVIISPLVYLAIVWNNLPDRIATHFDKDGNPSEFGTKGELWIGIGIITIASILIYLLLTQVYKIDPKKHAAENKDRLIRIAFTIMVFMSLVSITIVHSTATRGGMRFNMNFIFATMGFFWAIMGNYMYNIKPNYFAGFRLPWTLENEENWRKTHLIGGRLWFFGGLIIGITWLFSSTTVGLIITFTLLLIMIIVPLVYSYRLYKNQKIKSANS